MPGYRAPSSLDIAILGVRGVPSTYGGYETFLTALAPELVRRGHAVTVYARARHLTETAYRGVRVVPVPAIYRSQLETVSASLGSGLLAGLARHDIVLACNVANAVGIVIPRLAGVPVVLNTDGQEWKRSRWSAFGRRAFRNFARLGTVTASHLISDCEEMARVYRDEFSADSSVIPYCWPQLEPDGIAHAALELPERYLVCAGRFVPENHLVEIAQAYLRTSIPEPLVVIGEAAYANAVSDNLADLVAAHPERLVLAGHIRDRGAYAATIAAASVYVHGHSVGGINPALLEAMGVGANIIALDTPFNREALGPAGRYFSDLDGSATTAIEEMWEARDTCERRSEASHRARSVFSLEQIAGDYEDLLRQIVARKTGHERSGPGVRLRWIQHRALRMTSDSGSVHHTSAH